ncbi:MAG TPA: hypothetical protein VF812_13990 [Ktedonobacterales bacterium]
MNKSAAAPIGRIPAGSVVPPDVRLSGWRLAAARTVVLAISAVTMGLGVYALALWPRLATLCEKPSTACLLAPEQVAPLGRLGITPVGLTLAIVAMYCAVIALTNGVAALLFWRRSDDAMALLVVVTLVLLPAFFSPMYDALTGMWRTAAGVISPLGGISFLLLLGLFPSGRFAPRWVCIPLLALGLFAAVNVGLPSAVALPLVLGTVLSLIGAQVYRYRSLSSPAQRQQTKLVVVGLILAMLVNQLFWQADGLIPALQRKDSLYSLLLYPDFALIIGIIAITFGVAILRYRLYDIDVIIRRTLIYGVLTAILAALYFGVVIGAQAVTRRLTGTQGQPQVVIVATTLLIAALFTPLRRRIQAVIDRALYRSKYNTATTLTAFGVRMQTETELSVLCEQLVALVERTMQPEHIQLWLRSIDRVDHGDQTPYNEVNRPGQQPRDKNL